MRFPSRRQRNAQGTRNTSAYGIDATFLPLYDHAILTTTGAPMAITNHERVGKVLDLLRGLAPHIGGVVWSV